MPIRRQKGFSKKYDFWKCVWKLFLDTPDILCRYLECSPDSGLSFCNFRMALRQFWRILSTKNETFSFFTKTGTNLAICQLPKTVVLGRWFFSKCCRNFSRGLRETFWVCKTFSGIRAIQRTLNQGRVTPRKTCGYPILI